MEDNLIYDILKINEARMAVGWSYPELFRRAKCSPGPDSSQWREATVAKLAKALDLNLAELVIKTDAD